MLKSFLIKLRKKPKVVREQIALFTAAGFTGVLFIIWLFITVPGFFDRPSTSESGSTFSDLTEEISQNAPDLEEISGELRAAIATSSASSSSETVIPNEYPTSTTTESFQNRQSIRIATTSSESATGTNESIES